MTWGAHHTPHLCSLIQQDEELSEAGITVDWMSKTKKKYNDGNVLVGSFGKIGVGFDPSSTEGWDGVHFDLLLLLGTTKSLALLEQLWGRAFRSAYPHIVVFLDANRKADGHWKEMNKIAKLYQADVLETQEILTITKPTE